METGHASKTHKPEISDKPLREAQTIARGPSLVPAAGYEFQTRRSRRAARSNLCLRGQDGEEQRSPVSQVSTVPLKLSRSSETPRLWEASNMMTLDKIMSDDLHLDFLFDQFGD